MRPRRDLDKNSFESKHYNLMLNAGRIRSVNLTPWNDSLSLRQLQVAFMEVESSF